MADAQHFVGSGSSFRMPNRPDVPAVVRGSGTGNVLAKGLAHGASQRITIPPPVSITPDEARTPKTSMPRRPDVVAVLRGPMTDLTKASPSPPRSTTGPKGSAGIGTNSTTSIHSARSSMDGSKPAVSPPRLLAVTPDDARVAQDTMPGRPNVPAVLRGAQSKALCISNSGVSIAKATAQDGAQRRRQARLEQSVDRVITRTVDEDDAASDGYGESPRHLTALPAAAPIYSDADWRASFATPTQAGVTRAAVETPDGASDALMATPAELTKNSQVALSRLMTGGAMPMRRWSPPPVLDSRYVCCHVCVIRRCGRALLTAT